MRGKEIESNDTLYVKMVEEVGYRDKNCKIFAFFAKICTFLVGIFSWLR